MDEAWKLMLPVSRTATKWAWTLNLRPKKKEWDKCKYMREEEWFWWMGKTGAITFRVGFISYAKILMCNATTIFGVTLHTLDTPHTMDSLYTCWRMLKCLCVKSQYQYQYRHQNILTSTSTHKHIYWYKAHTHTCTSNIDTHWIEWKRFMLGRGN